MRPICGIAVLLAVLAVSACATKRYGRLQPLTATERAEYTCRDVKIEISKLDAFEKQVADVGKFDGKTVLGVMGDLGIGNGMEKRAALKTVRERRGQLSALSASKKCDQPEGGQSGADDPYTKLRKLKQLLDEKVITQEEFDAEKRKVLSQ